ncbi:hypothetical protein DPMN_025798 [Dreissena polymorpha]|uniref:Uncharacterized protein n=1 Tax=Dreissena polymorpha TaxID=45954 RepID=A0A9D4LQF1_DREPO|nr:hypothetical protein DPMN_025798 [Dreissena polymorpha]
MLCVFASQLKIKASYQYAVTRQEIFTDVDIQVIRNPNTPAFTSPACSNSITEMTAQGSSVFQILANDADAVVRC